MGFAQSWAQTGEGWMPQGLSQQERNTSQGTIQQICPQKCQQLGHKHCPHPSQLHSPNEGAEPCCSTPSWCNTGEQALLYSNFWFWGKNRNYSHILGTPRKAPPLQSSGGMQQSSSNPTTLAVLQHHHGPAVCYLLKHILSASLRNTRGWQLLWRAVKHEDQLLLEQPRSCRAAWMLTSLLCTY